jgi:hypothetical protein
VSDVAITLEVPQGQMDELARIIKLRAGYLRESMLDATMWAAHYISEAAGAATKVAHTRRPVKKNPHRGQTLPGKAHTGAINWWPFVAVRKYNPVKQIGFAYLPIDAPDIVEARRAPITRIRDYVRGKVGGRGLARASWAWFMLATKNPRSRASVVWPIGRSQGAVVRYEWNDAGASVELHNRLRYAAMAFKSKGRQTVDNIISRGTNSMRKDLERRAGVAIARGA